jgi:dipeptidyl aminopeptidase/acylaminoacyl peptidase
MDFTNYAKYNKVLNLPEDASLHELDGRYFDAVEYWTVQGRRGDENAKAELQLIDEAYGALFQRHLKEQEGVENWKANYTMQQVVTGQERMTKPSEADDDLWVPPRRQRSASPEVEDGMETDELEGYEKEQSTADEVGPVSSFTIREITGDIKDAPDNAVIVRM